MSWAFHPLPMYGFDVVMADPPWPWKTYSEKGQEKSPEAQYATMSLDDIAALPMGDLVGPGGVLFLWCTWPLIGAQAEIMKGWGFTLKTGGAWAKRTKTGKLRVGTGYVWRSVCEPYLLGVCGGSAPRGPHLLNLIETFDDSSVDGLAREHSRKPDEAYALIEELTPGARRADVFSRQVREGWSAFGNEITKFEGKAA